MTLSQVAALLGLDETDAVRVVPLTDEELAASPARPAPPTPTPNRAARRAGERRQVRTRR